MLYPTTARGLLEHLTRGADPPTFDQSASPLPVRLSTYSSLRAVSVARYEGGGARGGAGRRKSLRDGVYG